MLAVGARRAPATIRCFTQGGSNACENIFVHRHRPEAPEHRSVLSSSSSSSSGALAAWPVSLKDNLCTTDMPTTCASRMLEGYMSTFDATVVTLLRNSGAYIVGKTNCDEFGMGSTNIDSAYGAVINPASEQNVPFRVAGGSSGGAAASVAAKQCRVAIGTDTGGSVRLPAAYCGVYGLKPSYGMLSRWGLVSYADSLDTIGILASTSADLQKTFDVLSHFDENDPTSISPAVRERAARIACRTLDTIARSKDLRGLRVGVPYEFFAAEVNAKSVMPALRRVLSQLRSLGSEIVPVRLPSAKYALSAYYVLASAEASSNLARYDGVRYGHRTSVQHGGGFAATITRTRSEAFGEEVRKRLMLGTYSLTSDLFDNYFLQAQRVRCLVRRDMDRAFCVANPLKEETTASDGDRDGVHVLVHPSAVDVAPTLDEAKDKGLAAYTQDVLNVPASLAGVPAVSVPAGRAHGMPVGVTLTTQWGCESILWRLLQHLEL